MTATRPDLAFTVTLLSQYSSDPSTQHMQAAKRVLRYTQGTRDLKLHYDQAAPLVLNGFSDSSYGNCIDTRRSFSGYLFKWGNSVVSWRCRKQRSVAASSCEAEYMELAFATKHHTWLCRALHQLNRSYIPAALSTDSNSAIDLVNNPKLNDASKHIGIAYHFTRERVEDGSLTLLYVANTNNLTDICTKALPRPRHQQLCNEIFVKQSRRGVEMDSTS